MNLLPPCPHCSRWDRFQGVWIFSRPSLRFGQHARRWTLDSCSGGCPVFGDSAPWHAEFDRAPRFSGEDDGEPMVTVLSASECQAKLAQWWAERLATYSTAHWSPEKAEKWREGQE